MIIGLGMDVVEVNRIEQAVSRYGNRFLKHVFTETEQDEAPERTSAAAIYYAGRWAAKEAVSKVLGTGIGKSCSWLDITIEKTPAGAPGVVLQGKAKETALTRGIEHIHVTITHEGRLACAAAVGEGAAYRSDD